MKHRAVVIGGSMGGLFAAAFLQRIGWEAHVYERTGDDLAARGAGLGTHDALLEGLRALGIDTGKRLGVLVKERICLARDGKVVARRTLPQVMTHWARIYEALRPLVNGAHFHAGHNFTGSRQAGRALFDAAAARPDPIPVFSEMSSLNPLFVLPGALRERGAQLADGVRNSVTLGVKTLRPKMHPISMLVYVPIFHRFTNTRSV